MKMLPRTLIVAALSCACAISLVRADIHYVDINNSTPSYPYTNWSTAANVIQHAIEAATPGDTVLVNDGTYGSGGAVDAHSMSNRVVLAKAVSLKSVSGPQQTLIVGAADPVSTNGPAAMRCAYLTNGAMLIGFTLTNGHTRMIGDAVWERGGGGVIMEGGTVTNCIITGNSAERGGGALCLGNSSVRDCTISGNQARGASHEYPVFIQGGSAHGGGIYCLDDSVVEDCTISANQANGGNGHLYGGEGRGGGAYCASNSVVRGCSIEGNQTGGGRGSDYDIGTGQGGAAWGAGLYCRDNGSVERCFIRSNSAIGGAGYGGYVGIGGDGGGGGVYCSDNTTLQNCLVDGNQTYGGYGWGVFDGDGGNGDGGGVYCESGGSLNNCTLSGNSVTHGSGSSAGGSSAGGGIYCQNGGALTNCILWANSATGSGDNWETSGAGATFGYCSTSPDPGGPGHVTADPLFVAANDFHLQATSPCIDAGINQAWMAGEADPDGNPRIMGAAVDMGTYEHYPTLIDLDTNAIVKTLLWSDEFNCGSAPNTNVWSYLLAPGGRHNGEYHFYTNDPANLRIEGGHLIITALKETVNGPSDPGPDSYAFTSAHIRTEDKLTIQYGTIEARIQLPDLGNGLWPAFWTLGQDFSSVGWPACGEMDIFEMGSAKAIAEGVVNRRVGSHLHWSDQADNYANIGSTYTFPTNLNDSFHIYRMEWTPSCVSMFFDGVEIWSMSLTNPASFGGEEFHQPHYLILNLGVGGWYTGIFGPENTGLITAPFPAEYRVDYVRVYDNGYSTISGSGYCMPAIEPVASGISPTGSSIDLSFDSQAWNRYDVFYTTNLADSSWSLLQSVLGNGTLRSVSHAVTDDPARFYRVEASAAPPNLLTNPGFESGTTGWTLAAGGTVLSSTAQAVRGCNSLQIDNTGAIAWGAPQASQSFAASPGDVFNFQGFMLAPATITDGSFGMLKILFRDDAGNDLVPASATVGSINTDFPGIESLLFLDGSSPANQWIFTEAQGEAPAGTTEVLFFLLNVNPPGSSTTMHFDDIRASLL